jgi:hypothetical protein
MRKGDHDGKEDVKWLFGEDGGGAEAAKPTLVVNEKFATRYEQKNRDMHIARLEAEVDALDLSIESEDEEEDEVGELVTANIAGEFLEVYSRIRERDPALYDASTQFSKVTAKKNCQLRCWRPKNRQRLLVQTRSKSAA